MKSIRFGILLAFYSFQALYSNGQVSVNPQQVSEKKDSVISLYFSNQYKELAIYNGKLFRGHEYGIKGHGFYLSSDWQTGNVLYEGIWYNNVPIRYDIFRDQLMVNHPNNITIILFGERVQEFNFKGMDFFRFNAGVKNEPSAKIYQLVSDGKIRVYARRLKVLEENLENRKLEKKFIDAHKFYLVKDGNFHLIRNKNSMLNLLSDRRKEIQKELKKNNIRFKTNPESAIIHIADFYNQYH